MTLIPSFHYLSLSLPSFHVTTIYNDCMYLCSVYSYASLLGKASSNMNWRLHPPCCSTAVMRILEFLSSHANLPHYACSFHRLEQHKLLDKFQIDCKFSIASPDFNPRPSTSKWSSLSNELFISNFKCKKIYYFMWNWKHVQRI